MAWGETTAKTLGEELPYLDPNVQAFTANGTWTKPAGAHIVEITLVGGGQTGLNGGAGVGGNGGQAGEIVTARFLAALLPSTMSVVIGNSASSESCYITASGSTLMIALCGGTFGTIPADCSFDAATGNGALGGGGGTGSSGGRGRHSRFGPGASGGAANAPGQGGLGYGAGGGGGRQASSTSSGGGGGGGGYGTSALAATAVASTGGAGAPGYCLIVTEAIAP